MRGSDRRSGALFSYVDLEERVPAGHPLRAIREIANDALASMSDAFEGMCARIRRPSIPPEQLLRALLLQAFFGLRSERLLKERLDFDLLFRWFVGLGVDDRVWDASSFSKNRDRLLEGDAAAGFLAAIVAHPRVRRLISGEHFSEAALDMVRDRAGGRRLTLAADKGYDVRAFVADLRALRVTPHVAQNVSGRRSAIDGRTTRHPGYALSQTIRKRIEEVFGWTKGSARTRKTRFRGLPRVGFAFTLDVAAYNLIRLPKLLAA